MKSRRLFNSGAAFEGTSIGPGVRFDGARSATWPDWGSVLGDAVSFDHAVFEGSVSFYSPRARSRPSPLSSPAAATRSAAHPSPSRRGKRANGRTDRHQGAPFFQFKRP